MSRRVLALAATLALGGLSAGCASEPLLYYAPTVESARVILKDSRPDAAPFKAGLEGFWLPMIPFVPYGTREQRPFSDRLMTENVVGNLARSNAFRRVYGPLDPAAIQLEADVELEVRLLALRDERITTTWGLGLPGGLLWLFGLPQDLGRAEAALEVTWRLGKEPEFTTRGVAAGRWSYLIYQDSAGAAEDRVDWVIGEALDSALRRGVGVLRQQLHERQERQRAARKK